MHLGGGFKIKNLTLIDAIHAPTYYSHASALHTDIMFTSPPPPTYYLYPPYLMLP